MTFFVGEQFSISRLQGGPKGVNMCACVGVITARLFRGRNGPQDQGGQRLVVCVGWSDQG